MIYIKIAALNGGYETHSSSYIISIAIDKVFVGLQHKYFSYSTRHLHFAQSKKSPSEQVSEPQMMLCAIPVGLEFQVQSTVKWQIGF